VTANHLKQKSYSVLLIYPDYLSDERETYYTFVRASCPTEAACDAQLKAARAVRHDGGDVDQDDIRQMAQDFKVELVLRGHRKALAWD
jgi:hypothetical protein